MIGFCLSYSGITEVVRPLLAEIPRTYPQKNGSTADGEPHTEGVVLDPTEGANPPPYVQVRGVEVGIVLLVLVVWAGAIALFFNRWGKIRMLLPYQPDYKEQLKVPGPPGGGACTQGHGGSQACPQVCVSASYYSIYTGLSSFISDVIA